MDMYGFRGLPVRSHSPSPFFPLPPKLVVLYVRTVTRAVHEAFPVQAGVLLFFFLSCLPTFSLISLCLVVFTLAARLIPLIAKHMLL